jgi:hypothetical protein
MLEVSSWNLNLGFNTRKLMLEQSNPNPTANFYMNATFSSVFGATVVTKCKERSKAWLNGKG